MSMTFREIWESWLKVSLAEPTNDEIEERRHAFYAGGIAIMGIFLDAEDTPEAIRYIKSLRRELEEHTMSLWGRGLSESGPGMSESGPGMSESEEECRNRK